MTLENFIELEKQHLDQFKEYAKEISDRPSDDWFEEYEIWRNGEPPIEE